VGRVPGRPPAGARAPVRLPGEHLGRRFFTSLSSRAPTARETAWAEHWLQPIEAELWGRMTNADRRHSIEVAQRFFARRPGATRAELAGALLHDVGKVHARLGTIGRVTATIVGPRTRRFRLYHEHEQIGANMAAQAGSDPVTVALIRGDGSAAADLRAADDSI
jgi:putative nucleotidyltransferase with HDIG domain